MSDSTEQELSYTYIGEVNEHLICPICRHPFIDPAQTICGHTFCKQCITQALETAQSCPIDRQPLSSEDIRSAPKIVASLVDELLVACPRGCGVDVERGCLQGHLKGDCDLEEIKCLCGETVTRREKRSVIETEQSDSSEDEHECIHEWRSCTSCGSKYQRLHLKEHIAKCPSQKSPCQYCSETLPNSSMTTHHQTTCPSYPISCPHIHLGCPSTVLPRSSLPSHLQSCPFVALSPLLTTLLTRLSRLETQPPPPPDPETDRLRVDLNILNQGLSDLEIRFSNLLISERIRMGEEVERLRGQVGALRREVWFTRHTSGMDMAAPRGGGLKPPAEGGPAEGPGRRLSDSTATGKQIVKL